MKIIDFLNQTLPMLEGKVIDRMDKECEDGSVKAYWAGTIIRVDIKPKEAHNGQ